MPMFVLYCLTFFVAVLAIVVAVVLGESGPWYLSWLLGTGFMALASALGAIFLEAQDEARARKAEGPEPG